MSNFPTEGAPMDAPEMAPKMKRANWLGAPAYFNLNHACQALTEAFGYHIYLVGSALTTRDHRDVDVRCILDDDEFKRVFRCDHTSPLLARLSIFNCAISTWLRERTGLPIDFQFQPQSEANEKFSGQTRSALGIFVDPARAPQDAP